METPIYSRRYTKSGKGRGVYESPTAYPTSDESLLDMDGRSLWKYIIVEKAIEISERNCYGIDIYENGNSLIIKISLDLPCALTELGGILGLANMITISKAKLRRGLTLSILYEMDIT